MLDPYGNRAFLQPDIFFNHVPKNKALKNFNALMPFSFLLTINGETQRLKDHDLYKNVVFFLCRLAVGQKQ